MTTLELTAAVDALQAELTAVARTYGSTWAQLVAVAHRLTAAERALREAGAGR